ncbi:hypothetical protein C4578_00255 [Candidatus Microgenomates bacterium]|jgi:hypothetical protein|nr:MAG: hypothetical protein C4578_00255 [Candidatus Microgenomates bacterium]
MKKKTAKITIFALTAIILLFAGAKNAYAISLPKNFLSFFYSYFQKPKKPTDPAVSPTPTLSPTPTPIADNPELYQGNYFNNKDLSGSPVLKRGDSQINFEWHEHSPDSSVPRDLFSVRWEKIINLESGNYDFSVTADDGVRLYINGELILDKWFDQPATTYNVQKYLGNGSHKIVLEYYEAYGGAVVKFGYGLNNQASPNPTPTATPTATPIPSGKTWDIQSVSSMKESKDRVCGPRDQAFIERWIDTAKELGANYVAVETPYDNPDCGNSLEYTKAWVNTIRSRGLKIWHRHMFLSFEGIYGAAKNPSDDFLGKTYRYIKDNAWMFEEGDIFTPAPEPQNGGISGVTYCSQGVCIFRDIPHFNQWLRDSIDVSEKAFGEIGLSGKMKLGFFGFDGFTAWGSMNPDWNGILEDATVAKMGNLAIDHYPELCGDTMENALNELQARYPGVPIFISEWGSVGDGNIENQVITSMGAAKRPEIIGFNYWHMGMGGNESLINEDFSKRQQFDEVQSFYKGNR